MIFSIVIPTFNRLNRLKRAVGSCLHQNFSGPFEVIVVNDGGETVAAEDFPASERVCIHIENIENSGVSEARNHGIALARGQWVLLLDDDDFFLPNHLSVIHQHMSAVPLHVGWISTDCLQLTSSGTRVHVAKKSGLLSVDDFLKWDAITTNVSCFRKSFHRPFPSKVKYLEDFEHRLNIIQQGGYYRISAITSVFDTTQESATNGALESPELTEIYLDRFGQVFSEFAQLRKYKDRLMAPWLWRKYSDLAVVMGRREVWSTCCLLAANLKHVRRVTFTDLVSITLKRLFALYGSS